MMERSTGAWEESLVRAVRDELAQLEYLIARDGMGVEASDIHSQISRLSGLTDLTYVEGLELTETTRSELQLINEKAMVLGRSRLNQSYAHAEKPMRVEFEAAQSIFDALRYNIPYLSMAEPSTHAWAISKDVFGMVKKHFGDHVDFDIVERLVLVQDYRVMKLAGDVR